MTETRTLREQMPEDLSRSWIQGMSTSSFCTGDIKQTELEALWSEARMLPSHAPTRNGQNSGKPGSGPLKKAAKCPCCGLMRFVPLFVKSDEGAAMERHVRRLNVDRSAETQRRQLDLQRGARLKATLQWAEAERTAGLEKDTNVSTRSSTDSGMAAEPVDFRKAISS